MRSWVQKVREGREHQEEGGEHTQQDAEVVILHPQGLEVLVFAIHELMNTYGSLQDIFSLRLV
jgi:hypothetical protein